MKKLNKENIYNSVILEMFRKHYHPGIVSFEFTRSEMEEVGERLNLDPKNLGDVIYSFRFRRPLPKEITDTEPQDLQWIIELAGRAVYRFRLERINKIIPTVSLMQIKIPDSTPEIISKYSSGDEQALLTKIRYNRLIDIFLGITAYSLQNHLRTTVVGTGQIEIDEIYVGLNRNGSQFIIPVQAKSGNDKISIVQTKQDIAYCTTKYPELICRTVSSQFINNNLIAMFELTLDEGEVKIVQEKHYKLVPFIQISPEDIMNYRSYE
ncbi:endonuclease [Anabaena sp. CA = ATCC 33047]|uniref:endonuclease n=1 Tax=Anabaena sp. (strain CA / ATCC 33047) TaxID=52271 RepID=UPI00082CABDE|nr:endonuclease [Anabaena sp. CA = ATCC 33047]